MKKTLIALAALALCMGTTNAQAQWRNTATITRDAFGDVTGKLVSSLSVRPAKQMSFPYEDVRAHLVVAGCRSAWIGFNQEINLRGGSIGDGHTNYRIDTRYDGTVRRTESMWQAWGGSALYLTAGGPTIRDWKSAKTFEIAVPWHGEGDVLFRFDMTGSATAIEQVCATND